MNLIQWSVLLGLLVLQLILGVIAWWQIARKMRGMAEARQDAPNIDASTATLTAAMARIEAQIDRLEHAREPQASATVPQPQPGDPAYQLAQRMARNGASAAEIAEACGIAPREAELLCHLHAPTREAPRTPAP